MKKFITGIIVGAILFNIIPLFAVNQNFTLTNSDFKFFINDKEYKNKPVLKDNSSELYLPLSAIKTLGLNVNTDTKTKTLSVDMPLEYYTLNTTSEKILTKEENGITIFIYKGTEYINFATLVETCSKYNCSVDDDAAFKPKTSDNGLFIIKNDGDKTRMIMKKIPHIWINSNIYIPYNYYKKNIVPHIKLG